MTHPIYTQQQLQRKTLKQLKTIYVQIVSEVEVTDKRYKECWINAIITYQSAQTQKVTDEQALAQAELDSYITAQAKAIAPEPLTTVEITSHHYEVYCGKELVAYIAYDYDEFATQPWVVMVNGKEKFRNTTVSRCQRFIEWHHKDGTLRETFPAPLEVPEAPRILEISYYDQEAFIGDDYLVASVVYDHDNYKNLYWRVLVNSVEIFRDLSAARCHSFIKQQYQRGTLPVQEQLPEEIFITGNEIMSQIFVECEKYGFDIYNDGRIYHNHRLLGEVGCTDGNWWMISSQENQQQVMCKSAFDAVWRLSMLEILPSIQTKLTDCKELLGRPFEMLSFDECSDDESTSQN
ncbi:hypothetical protein WKK05_40020 (plasmid) [Nostoc sp. UHCC 0302]|uniref:hypothetical protein n=1 Tax=Nostoc sp. UHCC 0302 TaxID=3134896 RepID=UPI00311CABF9